MGWFPSDPSKSGATGALITHETYIPGASHGPLIYFSHMDLADELGRAEAAGGAVLKPDTSIGGEHGYMALIQDAEENRVALHAMK